MAVTFVCACGKTLRARDELAGKSTRCPQCGAGLIIPSPDTAETHDDDAPYRLSNDLPEPVPILQPPPPPNPDFADASRAREGTGGGESSLMEYSYLLLVLALVPLTISLLGQAADSNLQERFTQTIKQAPPEEQKRIASLLSKEVVSLDEALQALPGRKLLGAHLARDTSAHWVYAAIAAVAFLLLLGLFFSVERAQAVHLLAVGAFTGTIGIIFLLLVQFCSNFRVNRFHGRGWVLIIMLILTFIGWSYDSANDPTSSFWLSALGFTFGVGLCEEFTKAIPIFFYWKRDSWMGWRGACLWGLASGIGFGVSEGVLYSSRHYNGISGLDIYLVRFVSCVALHAMWSGSVGIAIARNVDAYEEIEDAGSFGLFMLRVMAVPMVLHGFYDTLLKKDMNAWALVVALLSFGWLAWHIELARRSQPGAGRREVARKRFAY